MQKYQKTFSLVAVFLLLVSMLSIIPAEASPKGAVPERVASVAVSLTTDAEIKYSYFSKTDTRMDSAYMVLLVYSRSGVYYPTFLTVEQMKKNRKFAKVDYPTTGDVVVWTIDESGSGLKKMAAIYINNEEAITISRDFGRPTRIMLNEYPYNQWGKKYLRWTKENPYWELDK